jgi:hypothetical protein
MKSIKQLCLGLLTALSSTILVLAAASLALLESGAGPLQLPLETTPAPTSSGALTNPTVDLSPMPIPGLTSSPTPNPVVSPSITPTEDKNFACPFRPDNWVSYIIQNGDTIDSLAARVMQSPATILKNNCLTVPSLMPGYELYLPYISPTATPYPTETIQSLPTMACGAPYGWVRYVIQPGDTLFKLSSILGVSVGELQLANCLTGTQINYGQVLYVPRLPPTRVPPSTGTPTPTQTHTQVVEPTTAVPTITHTPTTPVSTKSTATLTLGQLEFIYDGTPKSITASTTPAGLNVTITYDGSPTPPTAVGSYAVVATVDDPNYEGSASGTLVIARGVATITLSGLDTVYSGSPQSVTAQTSPAGLSITITYNGSSTPPADAGNYAVVATVNDPNYAGSASGTLVIARATAAVTLSGLSAVYDGSPHSATATTSPGGLNVIITYNGSTTPPTEVGSYSVVATVDNPNYQGSASSTLVIAASAP